MKWAVPVIVIALAASILAGSLGFQDTIKQTNEYTSIMSDLAPIADADPVYDSVNYNPLTNVTGWGTSVGYTTQNTASLYKISTEVTTETRTSAAIGTMGPYINTPVEPYYNNDWTWSDGSEVSYTAPSGGIGGWRGYIDKYYDQFAYHFTSTVSADVFIREDWSGDPDEEPVNVYAYYQYAKVIDGSTVPNKSIVTLYDNGDNPGDGLFIRTWAGLGYSYERGTWETHNPTYGHIRQTVKWELGSYVQGSGDYIMEGGNWYKVAGYDDSAPIIDYSKAYTLGLLSNSTDTTFTYRVITNSVTLYITPYTTVDIPSGSSTWSNGYNNDIVQFLADVNGLSFAINGGTLPGSPLLSTQPDMAAWADGYTGKILITITKDRAYWQGVTSFSTTKDFTVAEYQYELREPYNVRGPVQSITLNYETGGQAAIVETWVPQDPEGVLWSGATFPINKIFPTQWANDNLRVTFNSFTNTGNGLTVNGTTYDVADDGTITLDDKVIRVAGSAIEWTPDGTTTLVAPNGDRYDLGTRSGTFTLNGIWYGVLSLDSWEVVNTPAKAATFGIFPAVSWIAWVFVGVLAVGTVGVLATGRQLDIMDILALGLMAIVGVTAAVTL